MGLGKHQKTITNGRPPDSIFVFFDLFSGLVFPLIFIEFDFLFDFFAWRCFFVWNSRNYNVEADWQVSKLTFRDSMGPHWKRRHFIGDPSIHHPFPYPSILPSFHALSSSQPTLYPPFIHSRLSNCLFIH